MCEGGGGGGEKIQNWGGGIFTLLQIWSKLLWNNTRKDNKKMCRISVWTSVSDLCRYLNLHVTTDADVLHILSPQVIMKHKVRMFENNAVTFLVLVSG